MKPVQNSRIKLIKKVVPWGGSSAKRCRLILLPSCKQVSFFCAEDLALQDLSAHLLEIKKNVELILWLARKSRWAQLYFTLSYFQVASAFERAFCQAARAFTWDEIANLLANLPRGYLRRCTSAITRRQQQLSIHLSTKLVNFVSHDAIKRATTSSKDRRVHPMFSCLWKS